MYPQETTSRPYDDDVVAVADEPPVAASLRRLELEVDRAERMVMVLAERLDPVLRHGPESDRPSEARPSFEVPLADHLGLLSTRLTSALGNLDRTLDRLAL